MDEVSVLLVACRRANLVSSFAGQFLFQWAREEMDTAIYFVGIALSEKDGDIEFGKHGEEHGQVAGAYSEACGVGEDIHEGGGISIEVQTSCRVDLLVHAFADFDPFFVRVEKLVDLDCGDLFSAPVSLYHSLALMMSGSSE